MAATETGRQTSPKDLGQAAPGAYHLPNSHF